jgi:tRNA G18 (ribose-2'-O)-methylase SpoU
MILRTAAAFKISKVFCIEDQHSPANIQMHRSARQALQYVTLQRYPEHNLKEMIKWLSNHNYLLTGIEYTNDSTPLHNYNPPNEQPTALVFGNERNGISIELLQHCTNCLHIPLSSHITSLNVANAAAIAIYHFALK